MKLKATMTLVVIALGIGLSGCIRRQPNLTAPTSVPRSVIPGPTATITPSPLPPATPTPVPAARIHDADKDLWYGDYESALDKYKLAYELGADPEIQSAALLGIGRTYLYEQDYYHAVENFEELITNYPESPHLAQAYFFLAQSQEAQEHYGEAVQAYNQYLETASNAIEAYILDLRGDAEYASGNFLDAATSYSLARQAPSVLDEIFIGLKQARANAVGGDTPTALILYDDLYYRTNNENTRALISLRKGQIYLDEGQTEKAYEAFLDAVNNYPTSYHAYSALIVLVDAGVQVDELNRGLVDYFAGEYGVAKSAFDRYLQGTPEDPGTAYYYYGLSARALGGYEESIEWWQKLIDLDSTHRYWDEAWEQSAYTQWAFQGDYDTAIQTLLAFIDQASAHPRAAEFLFDAAIVSERAGSLGQAAELWEQVLNTYPDDWRAVRAIFLSGIAHYRAGDYSAALGAFQRTLAASDTLEERATAQFWIGKTHYALGDEEVARRAWEITAGIDPTGYYSERARDILYNRSPFTPPSNYDLGIDPLGERQKAENWLRTTFTLSESQDLRGLGALGTDPHLQRGQMLWDLGLYENARSEFEQLRQQVAGDPELTYRLANYLIDTGAYRPGIFAARGVLDLAFMDDAQTLSAPSHFNHIRFGTYYADLIFPLANEYGFHPIFIFSIVRQESLFESYIQSPATARGLMQIIPSTGAEIAENLGWPDDYSSDDLERPIVNLRFGIDYLNTQYKAFNGNYYAALAAYNGGPGNALQWYELAPDDPDLFLEIIRFAETREYIRGIYEIFTIYRLIYDRTP